MTDIFKSFDIWLKEKINSPLYIVFFSSFVAWNWKSFYILFFEGEEHLRGLTKIEYALLSSRTLDFGWSGFFGEVGLHLLDLLYVFTVPVALTFLAVWKLPRIHNLAHKEYLKFRFNRSIEFDQQNSDYQKRRSLLLEEQKVQVEKQVEILEDIEEKTQNVREIEQKLASPENLDVAIWKEEYRKIDSIKLRVYLQTMQKLIYSHDGIIQISGYPRTRHIDADAFAFIHIHGLVEYEDGSRNVVSLTEKGKFFLKQLALATEPKSG